MSTRVNVPELKKYMEKRLKLELNCNRRVTGILRGYDPFMNIVLDETFEERGGDERISLGLSMIRGNSIISMETVERV